MHKAVRVECKLAKFVHVLNNFSSFKRKTYSSNVFSSWAKLNKINPIKYEPCCFSLDLCILFENHERNLCQVWWKNLWREAWSYILLMLNNRRHFWALTADVWRKHTDNTASVLCCARSKACFADFPCCEARPCLPNANLILWFLIQSL